MVEEEEQEYDSEEDIFDETEEEEDGGIILDADQALVFAANTLTQATEMAEKLNDTAALMKIAGGWMEIHEYLAGVPHHEAKKQPLGFAPAKPTEPEEEEEELDDAIAAEGRSKRGLHAEYGELRIPKGGRFRRG